VNRRAIETLLKMDWKAECLLVFLLILINCVESRIPQRACGQKVFANGLIKNGTVTKKGQFPWLGVLCYGETTENCFCGASLITNQHAVTAAHCLYPKDESTGTYWPDTAIHFGRFDLTDDEEEDQSQVRKIIDIAIHNDWDSKDEKYFADIAVLRLNMTVRFNGLTQPVCLPTSIKFAGGTDNGAVVS